MENNYSLKLENVFPIIGRGLVLIPILRSPKISGFLPFTGNVELLLPNAKKQTLLAQFMLEHFNLNDRIGQWKIVILLPDLRKDAIPEGSEIIVTQEIMACIQY